MQVTSKSRRLALGGAVAIALAVGGTLHYRHISHHQREISRLEVELNAFKAANALGAAVTGNVPQMQQAQEDFFQRAAPQQDVGHLLEKIGTSVLSSQASERELTTRQPAAIPPFIRLPVALRFKGTWDSIVPVLEQIERYEALTRVEQVRLERPVPPADGPLAISIEFGLYSTTPEEARQCNPTN